MNTTRRVRITVLVALVVAIAGVVEAHGSAVRRTARPTVGNVVARIPIPPNSGALAVGEGAVWATSDAVPVLTRIDPGTNTVVARTHIASKNLCEEMPGSCGSRLGREQRRPQRLEDRPRDEQGRGDNSNRTCAGVLFRPHRDGDRRRGGLGDPAERRQHRPHRPWHEHRRRESSSLATAVRVPGRRRAHGLGGGRSLRQLRYANQRPDEHAGRSCQGDVGAGWSCGRLRLAMGGRSRREADRARRPAHGADRREVAVARTARAASSRLWIVVGARRHRPRAAHYAATVTWKLGHERGRQ